MAWQIPRPEQMFFASPKSGAAALADAAPWGDGYHANVDFLQKATFNVAGYLLLGMFSILPIGHCSDRAFQS